jgi:sRNA-binding regulator protein Hfq
VYYPTDRILPARSLSAQQSRPLDLDIFINGVRVSGSGSSFSSFEALLKQLLWRGD